MSSAYGGEQILGFGSSYERQFDDLTELVPSLFTLDIDRADDFLAAARDSAPARAPEALALLQRAASTRLVGSFRAGDGQLLTLAEGGRVESTRLLPTALEERAVYARDALTFSYHELGMRTRRRVGPAAIWWLLRTAPMVVPPVEALDGLTLESISDRAVRIRMPAQPSSEEQVVLEDLELEFDAQQRVTKVTRILGRRRSVTTIAYEGANVVVTAGKEVTTYAPATQPARSSDGDLVEIEMPLRNPRSWLELLEKTPEGALAVNAERQLLATYAALRDNGNLSAHLEALEKRAGKLTRGDFVLASAVLRQREADMKRLTSSLATGDPVRDYVEASRSQHDVRPGALTKMGTKHAGTHLGMLGTYRGLIAATDGMARGRGFLEDIRRFHATYPQAKFFRFALVRVAAQRAGWDQKDRALAIYDTLASDPELGPIADRFAIDLEAYDSALASKAADRAVRSFEAALERGFPFMLDWRWQNVVVAGRGQVGFELLMARWRAKVMESGTARQVHALVLSSLDPYGRRGGQQQQPDFGGLLRRLDAADDTDEEIRLQVARALLNGGHAPEAKQALKSLTDRADPSLRALELAASVAETEGDLPYAAALLDRVLRATEGQAVDLHAVRSWYSRLLALHFRRAGLSGGAGGASAAVRDALGVATRWRREDADNAAIDETCAASLFRLGRDEEARKHLSSIVERRPAEGAAWGKVGEILQQQGDLTGALLAWQDAARVEPTNPTWLLRRAEGLLIRAKGDDREVASGMLEKIANGKWQDRFMNVANDAGRLLPIAKRKSGAGR